MAKHKSGSEEDAVIGAKLRSMRNQRKLSQTELGEFLGVTFQQVQKYESGTNRLSGAVLQRLAAFLECGISDLLPEIQDDGKPKAVSGIARFTSTREGVELMECFPKIGDARLRNLIVDMVRHLSER